MLSHHRRVGGLRILSAREPALWQHHAQVGRVPLRFRTQELAQAAANQLIAEWRKK
jgi:hypothetical protein